MALRRLFAIAESVGLASLTSSGRQLAGPQYGYDLYFSFRASAHGNDSIAFHVECKNYTTEIVPVHVLGKLEEEARRSSGEPLTISHWILVSPFTDPNNMLKEYLAAWEREQRYPFSAQVWSPAINVQELFGLDPNAYDIIYGAADGSDHPRTWSDDRRQKVVARFLELLRPPERFPSGWAPYLKNPTKFCFCNEHPQEYERLFRHYAQLRCLNEDGAQSGDLVLEGIRRWLPDPRARHLLLLGEFGDGKSFTTYALCRHLAEEVLNNPKTGWVPLRLELKGFPADDDQNTIESTLNWRLGRLGLTWKGLEDLQENRQVVVVLDGLDEMSTPMDSLSAIGVIRAVARCCSLLPRAKIIITSRLHIFENSQHEKDLYQRLERLGGFRKIRLSPLNRTETMQHLTDAHPELGTILARLDQMDDPIGLATKPLFLQMLKATMGSFQPAELEKLDELTLYEQYSRLALTRKSDLLDAKRFTPTDLTERMEAILEQIAISLLSTNADFVSLKEVADEHLIHFAEALWGQTALDAGETEASTSSEADATARVGIRSLLARPAVPSEKLDDWPVRFCHRSMGEYFAARRLLRLLRDSEREAGAVLKRLRPNPETRQFLVGMMRRDGAAFWRQRLVHIMATPAAHERDSMLAGTVATLLCRLDDARNLPSLDWSSRTLDGADLVGAVLRSLNFANSSLRDVLFDNATIEDVDLTNCDLRGARIVETEAVRAISVVSSREIMVAYGDGTVRMWTLTGRTHYECRELATNLGPDIRGVGLNHGAMWVLTNNKLCFFDEMPDKAWQGVGEFQVKTSFVRIALGRTRVAVSTIPSGGWNRLLMIDILARQRLAQYELPGCVDGGGVDCECVALRAADGIRLHAMSGGNECATQLLPCDATKVAVRARDDSYLIACGRADGVLELWRAARNLTRQPERLAQRGVHQQAITSVEFLDEGTVVTGGRDRAICVTPIFSDNDRYELGERRRLQLFVHCKRLQIAGVKGPEEFDQLKRLMASAELDPGAP